MAITPADIATARKNCESTTWGRQVGDDITSSADAWLRRDRTWIADNIPPKNACFAYGFAGCPECGGKTFYETNWLPPGCSLDNPGHVKCENGHNLPNEKYPDPGTGYKGPDGRMHYFVGIYNAYVIERMVAGALDLSYAYSLTGKPEYAERCLDILDAIADIYPTCTVGSWDYPETKTSPNSGRLNRPQYQVGRVLIVLSEIYDQVIETPTANAPSVRQGLTRRENIEKNMLQDGAWYCYERSFKFYGLTNGEADYIKGAMVVGIVLGIPEYVHWAVDGPYGIKMMLANNLGRDGSYYETASNYSNYTRSIYRGYAEYLLNVRTKDYPQGVNLYKDPKLRSFMDMLELSTQIGGSAASYGDASPCVSYEPQDPVFNSSDFDCLNMLKVRTEDPAEKARIANAINWMSSGKPEKYYTSGSAARWNLFHLKDGETSPTSAGSHGVAKATESRFLGQKGMAVLRSGEGIDAHGVLLRYGPSLNHANSDALNFSYYAGGHDYTYDLGYGLGSAHVYTGWSRQTASHQLAVVDEQTQRLHGGPSGGSLLAFWNGKHTKAAQASSANDYRKLGVQQYNRTLFLVNDPDTTRTYAVDIMEVQGGKKHDMFTHSLGRDVTFGGVTAGEKTTGSLVGKGVAWGDKILVDGDIAGYPGKPSWVAPPGNGYGFFMEPQPLTENEDCWWADWKMPQSAADHMRTWFVKADGEQSLTAWAPGIHHDVPQAAYVIRRRSPADAHSAFVTVWEPYTGSNSIAAVAADSKLTSGALASTSISVRFKDGTEDVLIADGNGQSFHGVSAKAKLLRASLINGKITALEGLGVEGAKVGDAALDPAQKSITGKVHSTSPGDRSVQLDQAVANPESLKGLTVTFSNPGYSRNTAYVVEDAISSGSKTSLKLTEVFELGQGIVSGTNAKTGLMESLISHEYARPLGRKSDSEFFKGKLIKTADGHEAHVLGMAIGSTLQLRLDHKDGFTDGTGFTYYDIQPGDSFEILLPAAK